MEPVSPVIPGYTETIFAKDQPEYIPLPVLQDGKGKRLSRFKFTDEERKLIAEGADLFVCIISSIQPPISLGVYSQEYINGQNVMVIFSDFDIRTVY